MSRNAPDTHKNEALHCLPYFRNVVGNANLLQRLRAYRQEADLPHALLFVAEEGGEAFPISLAFARYYLCLNPSDTDACGECPSCKQLNKLEHPDFYPIAPVYKKSSDKAALTADFIEELRSLLNEQPRPTFEDWTGKLASGNKQLTIYKDESDEVTAALSVHAYQSPRRVVWVWMPEKMNPSCANKLLKVLEEPPAGVCFIMCSANPSALLPTITSRLQRIYVPPVSDLEMAAYLRQKMGGETAGQTDVIRLAMGNVRKADALVLEGETQASSLLTSLVFKLLEAASDGDVKAMKLLSDEISGLSRQEVMDLLDKLAAVSRACLAFRLDRQLLYMPASYEKNIERFARKFSVTSIMELLDELTKAYEEVRRNVNIKMIFFDLALTLASLVNASANK